MALTAEQRIQEDQYEVAYHWLPSDSYYTSQETYDFYLSMIPGVKGLRILETGCGDGRFSYELLKAGGVVTGLDISRRAIDAARSLVRGVKYHVGDATRLPFPDQSFDLACMIEVIEHLPEDKVIAAVQECKRVLVTNGLALVAVPSVRIPVSRKHIQHFCLAELNELFKDLFDMERVRFRLGRYRWMRMSRVFDNAIFSIKPLSAFLRCLYLNPQREADACQIVTVWRKRQ